MYAKAITSALSQQLPRGTYVKWDYEDYLKTEGAEMSEQTEPRENTQEELAQ
jgi:hypothetical protein